MNRPIVLVAALSTMLSVLACGTSDEPSSQPNVTDAGASGEQTQSQSGTTKQDASTGASGSSATPAADSCSALQCASGTTCQERDGKARCVAPDGEACSANEDCGNGHCVGGTCCKQACTDPEEACRSVEDATCEDGETCKYPVARDGEACEDADACMVGSVCKSGECQKGTAPRDCDDKNPCTNDSCDPKLGCKNQNNEDACDDADACTADDQCRNGECKGSSARDCSAEGDACNKGVCDPKDGSCKLQPSAEGASCDDADSCSDKDHCKAGKCQGENACGPNATECRPGMPRDCTCAAGYRVSEGRCVPESDECESSPCGANADCFDPSNDTGDVTCSCQPGFAGDAKQGCVAKDPCEGNPCGEGRGRCSADGDKYTCACDAGFRAVAGQCVCDMQGTFAVRYDSTASWNGVDGIEDGSAMGNSWAIARQNYADDGALSLELITCGETNIDLCGTGVRIAGISAEAYSQYVPIAAWDKAGTASTLVDFSLPAAVPGSAYKTPTFALLFGISLTDPIGEWPAKRQDVQGTSDFDGSATNGARWLDSDQDTLFGRTTYAVGPNGATPAGELAPIAPYAQTSAACPRSDAAAPRLAYNYPPGLDGLTPRRIKRFSSASRAVNEYEGTIQSCDEITGSVKGPDNGRAHMDLRIGSCVRVDGDSGEVACGSALLDFLDSTQAPSAFDSQTFIMKRVDANITCAQVRALSF